MYDVINPATEKLVTTIEHLDLAGTDAVISKAAKAFETWRHVAPGDRGKMLRRFAEVVASHKEELAQLEIANSGHTRGNALWEVDNVVNVLTYYSAAPERLFGRQIPVAGGIDVTFKEPLGVVGVIVPWNFPMPIAGWGFAPALAAGNTVVLKPAEYTPLTAMKLGEYALEAGLPEGVFNVLAGKGSIIGARFVTHPQSAQNCLHWLHRSWQINHGWLCRSSKACNFRTWRQKFQPHLRRCRYSKSSSSAPGSFLDNAGQDCCARSRILIQKVLLIHLWSTLKLPKNFASKILLLHRPKWVRLFP